MTDNRTTELLPCPFCGGEATVERIGKSGYYYVACNTAYCCDFGKFDTEAEAILAWNTRADYHGYEQAAIEAWENIKAWNTRAELGSGTCRLHYGEDDDGYDGWYCDKCGGWFQAVRRDGHLVKPKHCQECGKAVKR